MTYLITGANGMLGHDLITALAGRDVTALGRAQLDVTDLDAVRSAVAGHDVILNTAAYTKVDAAESDEVAAYAVNATGAANLARAAAETGALLVQYSTDYVFEGDAATPYAEGAERHPITAYGRTKGEGERLALELNPGRTHIVRTAWLYGEHGSNFPATMLRLAAERDQVAVVADQVGQPTWTADLARQTVALLDSGVAGGIFHGTNSGEASWFDLARAVFSAAGLDPDRVTPTDSTRFVRAAPRPSYSVLGHAAWATAGIPAMRSWQDALQAAFASGALGAA